jgi:hypothetical protein
MSSLTQEEIAEKGRLIDSVKNDILERYCFTQQQTKNIGPANAQHSGPILSKKCRLSKAQPVYSMSLKMTAQTKISYLKLISKIGGEKRIGPGKILKFLIKFYEKEDSRRKDYLKNVYGYLDQISVEVNNKGYDPISKKFSLKLITSIRNLDSYINILGFTRSDVREMITTKDYLNLFDLYTVISNYPDSRR